MYIKNRLQLIATGSWMVFKYFENLVTSNPTGCPKQATATSEADIRIYTDGSGREGKIGAAAVLYHGIRIPRTARYHLGSSRNHTFFEREGIEQLLGLRLLRDSNLNLNGMEVTIGINSHATIKHHNIQAKSAAGYIFDEIHTFAEELTTTFSNIRLSVRWTLGHVGIDGNEVADIEAKHAADNTEQNTNWCFGILKHPLPISHSTHLQKLKDAAKVKYARNFREGIRYRRVAVYDKSMPSNKYHKITSSFPLCQHPHTASYKSHPTTGISSQIQTHGPFHLSAVP